MKVEDLRDEYVPVKIQFNSKFGAPERRLSCGLDYFTVRCLLNEVDGHDVGTVKRYWRQASTVREFCELVLEDVSWEYDQFYAYVAMEVGADAEILERQLSRRTVLEPVSISGRMGYFIEGLDDLDEINVTMDGGGLNKSLHVVDTDKFNEALFSHSDTNVKYLCTMHDIKVTIPSKEDLAFNPVRFPGNYVLYRSDQRFVMVG